MPPIVPPLPDDTPTPATRRPRSGAIEVPAPGALGRGSLDAPGPRAGAAPPRSPAKPRPKDWRQEIAEQLNSLTVAPTPGPADDATEVIPASLAECKTHRDLELFNCNQAGVAPPPKPFNFAPPEPKPRELVGIKPVRLLRDHYTADDRREYRKGQVAELPEAEADLLIEAAGAELEPADVWVATLITDGFLVGDPPQLLTRAKPVLLPYRMAVALKNPAKIANPYDPRRLTYSADARFMASAIAIISAEDAANWDPGELKRPDPRPPIGRTVDPLDLIPKVLVRNTAGPMVGRYPTCTGGELMMDEEAAVTFSLMRFAETHPDCHANHFDGKPRVTILGRLSPAGEAFLERMRSFVEAQPGGWSVQSRGLPKYIPAAPERIAS